MCNNLSLEKHFTFAVPLFISYKLIISCLMLVIFFITFVSFLYLDGGLKVYPFNLIKLKKA